MMSQHKKSVITAIVGASLLFAGSVLANHAWANYHWARTANPFTLKIGDNVAAGWDQYLATTVSDWSQSAVVDLSVVPGSALKSCKPKAGQVEVCAAKYGRNGWLGLASIWASGDHITQGTVKMNDTYYNTARYNTPAWRNLVMCQEVGHTLGLDHQDEIFDNTNLGTCMDYTNLPEDNQHPNVHDYEMLETIYSHLDTTTTVAAASTAALPDVDTGDPNAWGREIKTSANGRVSLFERDFGGGRKLFTHVFWAEPRRADR